MSSNQSLNDNWNEIDFILQHNIHDALNFLNLENNHEKCLMIVKKWIKCRNYAMSIETILNVILQKTDSYTTRKLLNILPMDLLSMPGILSEK